MSTADDRPPTPRETIVRFLKRPIVALAIMVLAFVMLFPKIGPRQVTFHHHLPRCATGLAVSAYHGDELVRRHAIPTDPGTRDVTHVFDLPIADYLLRIELDCGEKAVTVERALALQESGDVDFDLSRECRCN